MAGVMETIASWQELEELLAQPVAAGAVARW
jgi:hypothetical protein